MIRPSTKPSLVEVMPNPAGDLVTTHDVNVRDASKFEVVEALMVAVRRRRHGGDDASRRQQVREPGGISNRTLDRAPATHDEHLLLVGKVIALLVFVAVLPLLVAILV